MFWAPAVACEISAPPSTPRGTSRSGPGLITFIGSSLLRRPVAHARCDLDLQRRLPGSLVVDLQRGVLDSEALPQQALKRAPAVVAVIARQHHDVRGQCW